MTKQEVIKDIKEVIEFLSNYKYWPFSISLNKIDEAVSDLETLCIKIQRELKDEK